MGIVIFSEYIQFIEEKMYHTTVEINVYYPVQNCAVYIQCTTVYSVYDWINDYDCIHRHDCTHGNKFTRFEIHLNSCHADAECLDTRSASETF